MTKVWISNQSFEPAPSLLIGEGGEAEIYQLDARSALKLFKTPSHPQFQGTTPQAQALRNAAENRIQEKQLKLLAFPQMPPRVVEPQALAWSSTTQSRTFVGYSMQLITDAYTLRQYSQRDFRENGGISPADIVAAFLDLHATIAGLHQNKIVVGDCNPMNILIRRNEAFLIDADSLQFGTFACSTYCANYVDPLICRAGSTTPEMIAKHSELTDWYAFAVLLWECLLYAHPYGGVFKPANAALRCGPSERPLRRISVLHPDVRYPAAAIPFSTLPDQVLDFYYRLLVNDERTVFPVSFLTNLKFRGNQAFLVQQFFMPTVPATLATPTSTAVVDTPPQQEDSITRSVFTTPGVILHCTIQNRRVRYLYHFDGKFIRDGGATILAGSLDPAMSFKVFNDRTVVSKGTNTYCLLQGNDPVRIRADRFRNASPVFDANYENYFWIEGGVLWKNSKDRQVNLGDVLEGQTRIAVGQTFGFGFYCAGEYRKAFIFRMSDGVKSLVDPISVKGNMVDFSCHFGKNVLWFLSARQEQTKIVNRCTLIDKTGAILATAECDEGDDHWLSRLSGKCAADTGEEALYAIAEQGLSCIEPRNGQLVETRQIPLANATVQPGDNLLYSQDGIYIWNTHEIKLLTPSKNQATRTMPATVSRSL